jgi:hypothetical protein
VIALRRRPQPALGVLLGGLVLVLAALLALAATHSPPNARPASPRAAPVEALPAAVVPGGTTAPSSAPNGLAPEVAPQNPPAAQAAPVAPVAPDQRPRIATTAPPESDDQQLPH